MAESTQDNESKRESEPSVNETVLREINALYRGSRRDSLSAIAETLGRSCVPPRRKAHVMVVGNHSAGKSSFINWYMDTDALNTGAAIETSGFTVVTHGNRRETWNGRFALQAFQHLQPLSKHEGFVDHLEAHVVATGFRNRGLVTLLDSPGLTDGDLGLPFDIEDIIVDLAQQMSLVVVFLDPIGQALCHRTVRVLERLNETCREKVRTYLSKADTCGGPDDLHKVIFQIAQGLSSVKNHAGSMPVLFIPSLAQGTDSAELANNLDDLSGEVGRSIELNVQDALNRVQQDAENLLGIIDASEKSDVEHGRHNQKMLARHAVLFLLGLMSALYPVALIFSALLGLIPDASMEALRLEALRDDLTGRSLRLSYRLAEGSIWLRGFHDRQPAALYICIILLAATGATIRLATRRRSVLGADRKLQLGRSRERLLAVKARRSELYTMYIEQSTELDSNAPDQRAAS